MTGTLATALVQAARLTWRAPRQAALRLRMAWWLGVVSLLAKLVSLPRAQQLIAGRGASSGPAPEQLAQAIDSVLHRDLPFVRGGRCWKRALVLQRFLAQQHVDCRINFGVRPAAGGVLEGHAWLERDGQPFLEPDTSAYVVTFTLPRTDAQAASASARR